MAPASRPTIREIEKTTGFSRGTISRALHGNAQIDPKTRELILAAAAKLGYVPHRGMARPQGPPSRRYGVLLPNLDNPYFAELIQCLDLEVRREDRILVLALHHYDAAMTEAMVRHWLGGETDGVIIDPPDLSQTPRLIDYLRSRDCPVVFLHGRPSEDFCMVRYSREAAYRRAFRQMRALGHRRVGYVGIQGPHARWIRMADSFGEYRRFMESQGESAYEELLYFGGSDAATGYRALAQFVQLPDRPTAVVCFNDILACGIAKAAREMGIRVPDDLSILGSGNVGEADRMGLTTIQTDRAAMAREVYRLLEQQRLGGKRLQETITLPSELVMRHSLGLAPKK